MNNLYVDALSYISTRPLEEKLILFEYLFDRKLIIINLPLFKIMMNFRLFL